MENTDIIKNHTFVILAYKTSEYLEECIESILNQKQKSKIVIATSTPNEFISTLGDKYGISVLTNPKGSLGMVSDFNFALEVSTTQFVTIAHQDDVYLENYFKKISSHMDKDTIIAFTDYGEIHPYGKIYKNKNLRIKRLLLKPIKINNKSKFLKRRILSLGNPICCPSVTFNKNKVKDGIFTSKFESNMDWCAWEKLTLVEGRFLFIKGPLMLHRIHEESTTTVLINSNKRTIEDYEMFCKFWPKPIAKSLANVYRNAEKNND